MIQKTVKSLRVFAFLRKYREVFVRYILKSLLTFSILFFWKRKKTTNDVICNVLIFIYVLFVCVGGSFWTCFRICARAFNRIYSLPPRRFWNKFRMTSTHILIYLKTSFLLFVFLKFISRIDYNRCLFNLHTNH